MPGPGGLLKIGAHPHDDTLRGVVDGLQLGGDGVDPGWQMTGQHEPT